MIRTLKLTVAYDGTRYAGWQRQSRHPSPGLVVSGRARDRRPAATAAERRAAGELLTIQGELERVLSFVLRKRVTVIGSGRTDAGVHAEGQVAHIKVSGPDPFRLLRSVNALLPPDIAVTRIEPARRSFHARFDALRKRYRYRLFIGPVVPPFIRPYVYQIHAPLDLSLMRREAAALRGCRNFRAFANAKSLKGRRAVRRITDITLRRRGEEIHLDVEGNGFLHMMVRSIAGTLIDVGRGMRPAGTVRRMLRSGDRRLAGTTAPANGLTLVSVRYRQGATV